MKIQLATSASALAFAMVAFSPAAFAKAGPVDEAAPANEAPATLQGAEEPSDSKDAQVSDKDIVVTGSRIQLPNLKAFEPTISTVNQEYLTDRGLTNVADALNELPGIRGSVTPGGAQGTFGQAVNFINIFGLGSNRTLTLINGQRVVSSNVSSLFSQGAPGTQVDANIIPSALTERTDVVLIGGSPVYGSDAIGGTVNYIINTKYKGLQVSALTGVSEQGDGFRYNGNITYGRDFLDGRANITVSYTRDSQAGALYNSRDFLRQNVGGATNPSTAAAGTLGRAPGIGFANDGRLNSGIGFNDTASDGFPGTVQVRDLTISFLTQGGLITDARNAANGSVSAAVRNYQFDTSGNLVPFNRGIPFVGINSSGGDGFRFNDYSQLTSDLTRDIFNGYLTFKASPAVELFVEGLYYHAFGNELVQQPTFNSSLFAGASGPLTYDVNSPFLNAQARGQLQALGVNSFQISRASVDLADVTGFSNIDLFRIVGGLRGDFNLRGRDFHYSVTGNFGRNDTLDTSQDLNRQNFVNAVNVTTNAQGQIVCTTTPTRNATPGFTPVADPRCVPLNLLGSGLADPAARAYVIAENVTRSIIQQYDFQANVNGSPFALFGNNVGVSLGYEHREERASFVPSPFQQQGLGRSAAIAPVSGAYNTDEIYGETIVPIISPENNLWFANRFQVYGRFRYVDNTVNGGFFSWAAGGAFSPVRDITFRGNYTKSFRAPAVTELFLPTSNAFSAVPDLCSPANIGAGAAPATRRANCTAFLAAFPNATPLDAASATVPIRTGGNPSLQNEVASSFTYGVIIQPRWVRGLSISVDYVNINLANPIANLSVAQIASACFDNPDFNTADPANGNAFCSRIGRYAQGQGGTAANGGNRGGQVVVDPTNPQVVAGFVNGNNIRYDGIQATLDYATALNGLGLPGRLGLGGTLDFTRSRLVDITGVAPSRTDGTVGDPTWQGQVNVRYAIGKVSFFSSFNYVGEQLISRVSRGPDIREIDKYNAYWIINPSIAFEVNPKFRINFSVTNATNYRGQTYNGYILPASYNSGIPDLGRRFAISVRAKL
ncbi:MAG: TonB-dependent receptor [Sphingomonas sp.]